MSTAAVEPAYEKLREAEAELESAINTAYPAGSHVRYRSGRGWGTGTANGWCHRAYVSITNDRTHRGHNVWFRDVELVAARVGK